MTKVALITGATSGIGFEMAKLFAQNKTNLLLVARNEERLNHIKQQFEKEYKIHTQYVATDLSKETGINSVLVYAHQNQYKVEYLVNNAGFGDFGSFTERSLEAFKEMIDLNISALVELTHCYAKQMVERGYGRILNVASTSGFQPDPYLAVYGASKAFVINFTEAIHKELENTGVTATVLSPGPTETNFTDRSDMKKSKLFNNGGILKAEYVAKVGYKAMLQGKLHSVPGFKNRISSTLSSMIPSSHLRLSVAAKITGKVKS